MTPTEFKLSLAKHNPPAGLPPALIALWWLGKNDWSRAHQLVMNESDAECAWVHAHLHRAEGDLDNARYWYRLAGREPVDVQIAEEWLSIVSALLGMGRS